MLHYKNKNLYSILLISHKPNMVYVLIHTQHRITVVNECATILYMIQYDTGYVMLRINTLDDDRSPFIPPEAQP